MSIINFVPFMLDDLGSKSTEHFKSTHVSPLSNEYEEDESEVRFSIDLPGVKASDLEVTVHEGQLCISGSRKSKSRDGTVTKRARFSRSFPLDETSIELSQMKANLADGVLEITVPKRPKPKPIKIAVTTNPVPEHITNEEKPAEVSGKEEGMEKPKNEVNDK